MKRKEVVLIAVIAGCFGAVITMIVGLFTPMGVVAQSQPTDAAFDKITCREIEVVNEEGQTIALIDEAGVGDGVLTLNNKDGKQKVLLSAFDRGGTLRLSNKDGEKRVLLGAFDRGGTLMLSNKDKKLGATLSAFDRGGTLRLSNKDKKLGVVLKADDTGGNLGLYNHKGRFRSYTAE